MLAVHTFDSFDLETPWGCPRKAAAGQAAQPPLGKAARLRGRRPSAPKAVATEEGPQAPERPPGALPDEAALEASTGRAIGVVAATAAAAALGAAAKSEGISRGKVKLGRTVEGESAQHTARQPPRAELERALPSTAAAPSTTRCAKVGDLQAAIPPPPATPSHSPQCSASSGHRVLAMQVGPRLTRRDADGGRRAQQGAGRRREHACSCGERRR
ncbi:protein bassoon-like [Schistocerca serialis cubense]|uniref:protein bassoon-like n=1 Tax=Schistocerca serialis cubense TaxID=2023355 RepID=UPI00214F0FBD|nr:protein bassoon-like [Schistocerca serialis cubense]